MSDNETTEFYTIVYRVIGEKAKHDEWWQALHPLFLADEPISITAIAKGDALANADDPAEAT